MNLPHHAPDHSKTHEQPPAHPAQTSHSEPHAPSSGAHRVPVVPVLEQPSEEHGNLFAQNLGILFFVLAVGLGGWYYWTHRTPAEPGTLATNGQVNDVRLVADAPSHIMTNEEARVSVALTNSSVFQRTLGVGIIDDGVFEASGSRRIVTLGSHASETISLPFSGHAHGAWNLRIGIYDENEKMIATSSQPVSVVEPSLSVRFDMGEKASIHVPKNGRIYATVRWDTLAAPYLIKQATIHVTGSVDRTVSLKHLRVGARGSFIVWATVPAPLRGKTVLLEDLDLHARTTWLDQNGAEIAVRASPSNTAVRLSAWPRLFDSHGIRISSGPMPLRAGVPSTFWVNLSLGRETRDTITVLAVAKLAPGVEFTGKTWTNNHERISFDKSDRAIVWETHPLKNTDPNEPLAGFEIRFTPSVDSTGTLPVILESLIGDREPDHHLNSHDFVSGPVVADFRFDGFAAAENGVRK